MLHILYDYVFHLGIICLFILTKLWQSCEETGKHSSSVIQNGEPIYNTFVKGVKIKEIYR